MMSAFDEWFYSAPHRKKYPTHPAYLAASESWDAALEAAAKEAERTFRVNIPRFKKERDAAFDIAVAIRALKEQTNERI